MGERGVPDNRAEGAGEDGLNAARERALADAERARAQARADVEQVRGRALAGVERVRDEARVRAAAKSASSQRQAVEGMRVALAQYAEQVRPLMEQREAFMTNVLAGLEVYEAARRQVVESVLSAMPHFAAALEPVLTVLAETASTLLRLVTPVNLQDLPVEAWFRLVEISAEQRIGVVWAPQVDVLRALLDAPDEEARASVVEESADVIVADCAAALRDVEEERFVGLAGFGLRAVAAYEAGHPDAAQALAANVLDSALHLFADSPKMVLRTMREWDPIAEHQVLSMRLLRLQLAGAGIPTAYRDYKAGTGDARFSRNGTAHAVNEALYTRANAARAISLAATWLRLVQATHLEGVAWHGQEAQVDGEGLDDGASGVELLLDGRPPEAEEG